MAIKIEDTEGLHPSVPRLTFGTFSRLLGDHERYPYEVRCDDWRFPTGLLCFAATEVYRIDGYMRTDEHA